MSLHARIHFINFARTLTVTSIFFLIPLHFLNIGFNGIQIGFIISCYALAPLLISFPTGWIRLAVHPRFQVHFTPTYASWLHQVEIWFNIITQKAIRRGTFRSVKDLVGKIDHFVQHSNSHTRPLI